MGFIKEDHLPVDCPKPGLSEENRSPADYPVPEFYENVMKDSQKSALREAVKVEGLDVEIALWRLKVRDLLSSGSADYKQLRNATDMLRKLVGMRFRITQGQSSSLQKAMEQVAKSLERLRE